MPEPRRGLSDATGGRKANAGDYQTLVRTPSYVLNCAAQTAVNFAIGGMAFWMPRFLTEERGVSEKIASPIFGGISALAGLTATLAGGIAGDKLRPRFGGSYFLVSAGGVLAGLPVFVAMLFAPFPWAWGLVFLAVFCLFFNTGPANTALANVTHPAVRASAFALNILVIHALGDAISPPVIGWIAEHTGAHGMRTAFMFVSAPIALGGFLWLWAARYLARDTELAPRRLDDPLVPGFPVIVPAPTGEATPRH
jgi:sugar phosphate permease